MSRKFQLVIFIAALLACAGAQAQTIESFNPLPNGAPIASAIQPDGKIVIGGSMTTVASANVADIARLNIDGSVDPSFIGPSSVIGDIKAIAIQADGKILIGGSFIEVDASPRNALARLNANGTLDASFVNPGLLIDPNTVGSVWAIAIQPDGKIVVGGDFTLAGQSTSRGGLARFNSNGSLDSSFIDPQICGNGSVRSLALQANGAVVVGGYFYHIGDCNGPFHEFLARFSSNGTFDAAFPVDTPPGYVSAGILIAPDASIYVAGGYPGTSSGLRLVSKLTSAGALVGSYDDLQADGGIGTFALQTDGKMLIGGNFQSVGGQARHALVRLNANGSVDTSFADLHFSQTDSVPNGTIYALAVQTDGKLIASGNFTFANGQSRQYMARVATSDHAASTISGQPSGSNVVISWTRTGTGPELAQAPTLMHSSDGVNFSAVGSMARIANGWQITAPYNVNGSPFFLRADAWVSSGAVDGSAGRIHSPLFVSDRIFADGFD